MSTDTGKQIAERFIGSGDNIETRRRDCADAIDEALRNEREAIWGDAIEIADHALCCGGHGQCGHGPGYMADEIAKRLREARNAETKTS